MDSKSIAGNAWEGLTLANRDVYLAILSQNWHIYFMQLLTVVTAAKCHIFCVEKRREIDTKDLSHHPEWLLKLRPSDHFTNGSWFHYEFISSFKFDGHSHLLSLKLR